MQDDDQLTGSTRAHQPLRVLVLDDDPSTAIAIAGYLQNLGCEVVVASTAEQAISVGHDFEPQVLVTDWKLGEALDGIDAARILQAEHHLVVIFVTGHARAEMQQKLHDLEPVHYFRKPVSLAELSAAVRESSIEISGHQQPN